MLCRIMLPNTEGGSCSSDLDLEALGLILILKQDSATNLVKLFKAEVCVKCHLLIGQLIVSKKPTPSLNSHIFFYCSHVWISIIEGSFGN